MGSCFKVKIRAAVILSSWTYVRIAAVAARYGRLANLLSDQGLAERGKREVDLDSGAIKAGFVKASLCSAPNDVCIQLALLSFLYLRASVPFNIRWSKERQSSHRQGQGCPPASVHLLKPTRVPIFPFSRLGRVTVHALS